MKSLILAAATFAFACAALSRGDDRFVIAVKHDGLVISSAHGEVVFKNSVHAKAFTVNGASFQLTYDRNNDGLKQVILKPAGTDPLHFHVLGKDVDTVNNSAVTLTFSANLTRVSIKPNVIVHATADSVKSTAATTQTQPALAAAPAPDPSTNAPPAPAPVPPPRSIRSTTRLRTKPPALPPRRPPMYPIPPAPCPCPDRPTSFPLRSSPVPCPTPATIMIST